MKKENVMYISAASISFLKSLKEYYSLENRINHTDNLVRRCSANFRVNAESDILDLSC